MMVSLQALARLQLLTLGGVLNMKLKKKLSRPARKGINPFTKEPCVFRAKPASKIVKCYPTNSLKEAIN